MSSEISSSSPVSSGYVWCQKRYSNNNKLSPMSKYYFLSTCEIVHPKSALPIRECCNQ